MNEKKWFITQAVLFVIYLSMTMIFLVGWNQIMYSEENANALVSIVTGIYFGGGGLVIPVAWFAFVFYRGLKEKTAPEAPTYLAVANRYLFPAVCYLVMIATTVYVGRFPESVDYLNPTYLYFCTLTGALFIIVAVIEVIAKKTREIKPLLLLFILASGGAVFWNLDLLISVEFREAMIYETRFLYFLTFRQIYYFIIILGISYFFAVLLLYFNITDRLRLVNLLLNITMFVIVIYNLLNMISFFNYLNVST